jgi:aquaporin Z
MNKYAAEFFGTFAMVFAGTGAIVANDASGGAVTHVGVAITWGLIVMAMIFALGDVSGAHINPAVTCGFWLSGRFPARRVGPYVLAQLAGALLAIALLRVIFGNRASLGASLPAGTDLQSFALELVLTAILMFVILNVSTGPKEVGVIAGIAVGGVIGLEAMFAGPICGASMNPARSLAPALVSGNLRSLWVYIVAPVAGAALAVPCWRLTRPTTPAPRAPEKLPLEA